MLQSCLNKSKSSQELDKVTKLLEEDRVNFIFQADYSEEKDLFKTVTHIIDKVKYNSDIKALELKQKKEANKKAAKKVSKKK